MDLKKQKIEKVEYVRASGIIVYDPDSYSVLITCENKPGTENSAPAIRYDFPKGKIENNEGDKEAAVRELLEETGVKVNKKHLKDKYSFESKFINKNIKTHTEFKTIKWYVVDIKNTDFNKYPNWEERLDPQVIPDLVEFIDLEYLSNRSMKPPINQKFDRKNDRCAHLCIRYNIRDLNNNCIRDSLKKIISNM